MSYTFKRRKSSVLKVGPRATSLIELPEDVLVRIINYYSIAERVTNSRINRKFNHCINVVWKNERSFPFYDRFGFIPTDEKGYGSISEKNHLRLLLQATNVKSIDARSIPTIYPSDDEWFSNFGKCLSKVNHNISEVKLFLLNDFGLNILTSYLRNLETENNLEVLHLDEADDLHQVSQLFKLLVNNALKLKQLFFEYPDDDSNRLDCYLKLLGPRLVVLSCSQFMKFNLGSSLQILDTREQEFDEDELRMLCENCPNLYIIRGIIRGNAENYFSLAQLKCFQVVSLADFHFDIGLEMLKNFIQTVGHNLRALSLHNLVKYEKTGLWSIIMRSCKNLEILDLNACLCVDDTDSDSEFLNCFDEVTQNLHIILKNSRIYHVSEDELRNCAKRYKNIQFTLTNYGAESEE